MVTRDVFTCNIVNLMMEMILDGDKPFGDTWKRLPSEQQSLFEIGRKLENGVWVIDDINKIVTNVQVSTAGHAVGKAIDIYFMKPDGSVDWNNEKWHKIWEEKYGGDKLIVLKNGIKDYPHFAMK